jgi:VIT1/CCC1 family predicted Fe2+/Mn2+ transporter
MQPDKKKSSLPTINFFTGASDGILLPFWLCIVLFAVFQDRISVILFIGLLLSFIGAVIFGLARALGEKNEIRHHHPQLSILEGEKEQGLLQHIGIETSLRMDMKVKMEEEKALWLKEIKENNLGWEKESPERAAIAGFQTAVGFLAGACLMLLPVYVLIKSGVLILSPHPAVFSIIVLFLWPLICLFIFSGYKSNYIGLSFWKGGLKGVRNGAIALLLAFLIVYFFGA